MGRSLLLIVPLSFLSFNRAFHLLNQPGIRRSQNFALREQLKSAFVVQTQPTRDDTDIGMFWPQDTTRSNSDDDDDENEEENGRLSAVFDSILKVHCTHSEPDFLIPWQKQHQSTSTSSGFVISIDDDKDDDDSSGNNNKRVMTNAHSVEYGSIVQVQRRGDERKYQATVESFANECDLAILNVDEPSFWKDLEALEFGTLPSLQDEVEVLGYPTGGDSLSVTQGVVSRVEMLEYAQASSHLLAIQIDAAINAGNSGGPVVNEDLQVIGVAFQGLDGAENIGYVVPVTVVQHVLEDIRRNQKYTGFCSLGVGLARLESTAFRKSLGMRDDDGNDSYSGIMVKEASPTAASNGILLPKDVFCSVDGIPVANDGKIPFRPGERVSLSCYIQTKFVGDSVKLQVLREKKEVVLSVPVSITKRRVPAHFNNRPPPYLVIGGLVFTALSEPYLNASDAWDSYVSGSVSYLLGKMYEKLERETDEVVILAQVLAHPENLGYDKLGDLHLEKVNGVKVRSLSQLKNLVDECEDKFLQLEFAPDHRIIVLERSSLDRVTEEVCEEHSIPRPLHLHDQIESKSEVNGETESLVADLETKTVISAG